MARRHRGSIGLSRSTGRNSAPAGDQQALLLQLMPPGVNLLPGHLMALRNLRHRRAAHTDRQNDRQLLLVAPTPTPLQPQNIATHHKPRIRHVVNDVVMHVS
jgi:hypothetical protein